MYINDKMSFHRYTLVFVYYAFSLASMVLVRPLLSAKFVPHHGTKSIYAALFFYPVLVCLHAVLAGLICKHSVSCCVSVVLSLSVWIRLSILIQSVCQSVFVYVCPCLSVCTCVLPSADIISYCIWRFV